MTAEGNYLRITKFLRYITQFPIATFPTYFINKDECVCIVRADRLSSLPTTVSKYTQCDEFWIQFDADNKIATYYAFDIKDYTSGEIENEQRGEIGWDKIETQFFHFLATNLKELTCSSQPYSDLGGDNIKQLPGSSILAPTAYCPIPRNEDPDSHWRNENWGHGDYHRRGAHTASQAPFYGPHHNPTPVYSHEEYKERSAFTDKVEGYAKQHQTSLAIDFIHKSVPELVRDNKQALLDSILRFILIDRLNLPIMASLIEATKGLDKSRGREEFIEKYKAYIGKIRTKNVMANKFLARIETDAKAV
jgi:hypothetical protein